MNKKILILIGLTVVSLSLFGCNTAKADQSSTTEASKPIESEQVSENENMSDDNAFAEANPVEGVDLSTIKVTTMDGNEVDGYFKGTKLTVLNVWGTFCGPCIDEMPDLQKISEEFKASGVRVTGLITDGEDASSIEDAKSIMEQTGVTYDQILPKGQIMDLVGNKFDYVPATVFVDENGMILKTFIPGSVSHDEFKSIIEGLLGE